MKKNEKKSKTEKGTKKKEQRKKRKIWKQQKRKRKKWIFSSSFSTFLSLPLIYLLIFFRYVYLESNEYPSCTNVLEEIIKYCSAESVPFR